MPELIPWSAGWVAAEVAAAGVAVVVAAAGGWAGRPLRWVDAAIAVEVGLAALLGPTLAWCDGSGWTTPHGFPLPWIVWSGVSSIEYDVFAVPFVVDVAVYAAVGFQVLRFARGRWGAVARVAVAAAAAPLAWFVLGGSAWVGRVAVGFDRPVDAVWATSDVLGYDDPRCVAR